MKKHEAADPSTPTPGSADDPLDRAVEHAVASYPGDPLIAPDEKMVRRELATVIEVVRAVRDGRTPTRVQPGTLDHVRLLGALRRGVLEVWTDADGPVLPTMRALEEAQAALMEWGEHALVHDVLSPFSRGLLREVAHLLRSPLGSLVMLAETLRGESMGPLSEQQEKMVRIIHRAALGLATTVGNLLVLVSDEERRDSRTPFGVDETIRTVADIVRPVAEARGGRLVVEGSLGNGKRVGPAAAVGQALLTIATTTALSVRGGTVTISAHEEPGDGVRFGFRAVGDDVAEAEHPDQLLRVFLMDQDTGSYTLSPQGLGFAAGRELVEALGSELDLSLTDDGLPMAEFSIALPRESSSA